MNVLTKDDASSLLKVDALDSFVAQRCEELRLVGSAYTIPDDTVSKTALAKFLTYLLLKHSKVCVYLTGWGLRPTSEHLDLFYGYRRSAGEARSLSEAPLHVFGQDGNEALASILCMVFYFALEAWVFDGEGKTMLRINHDGRIETRADGEGDLVDFASEPQKYLKAIGARAA
jgi:hypothetical protein